MPSNSTASGLAAVAAALSAAGSAAGSSPSVARGVASPRSPRSISSSFGSHMDFTNAFSQERARPTLWQRRGRAAGVLTEGDEEEEDDEEQKGLEATESHALDAAANAHEKYREYLRDHIDDLREGMSLSDGALTPSNKTLKSSASSSSLSMIGKSGGARHTPRSSRGSGRTGDSKWRSQAQRGVLPEGERRIVGLAYDDACLQHEHPTIAHPERPARILCVMKTFELTGLLGKMNHLKPVDATKEELLKIHSQDHLDQVDDLKDPHIRHAVQASLEKESAFANEHTALASYRAAGAVMELVKAICDGRVKNGIAVVRPPGHHAEETCIKGFCVFNNLALAAAYVAKSTRVEESQHAGGMRKFVHAMEDDRETTSTPTNAHSEDITESAVPPSENSLRPRHPHSNSNNSIASGIARKSTGSGSTSCDSVADSSSHGSSEAAGGDSKLSWANASPGDGDDERPRSQTRQRESTDPGDYENEHAKSGPASPTGTRVMLDPTVSRKKVKRAAANYKPLKRPARVLVVDWDVHHGNGTQHAFDSNPNVLVFSVHRWDLGQFYPGGPDGAPDRVGSGPGFGRNINIGWNGHGPFGDSEYLAAWRHVLMPAARQFDPDIVLVSAGFDAAKGDPLGGCGITPEGYGELLHELMSLADGRVLLALEGGYSLEVLSESHLICAAVLMGAPPPRRREMLPPPSEQGLAAIAATLRAHRMAYWHALELGAISLQRNLMWIASSIELQRMTPLAEDFPRAHLACGVITQGVHIDEDDIRDRHHNGDREGLDGRSQQSGSHAPDDIVDPDL